MVDTKDQEAAGKNQKRTLNSFQAKLPLKILCAHKTWWEIHFAIGTVG